MGPSELASTESERELISNQEQQRSMLVNSQQVSTEFMMAEVVDEDEMRRQIQEELSQQMLREMFDRTVHAHVEVVQAMVLPVKPEDSPHASQRRWRGQCLCLVVILVLLGVALIVALSIELPQSKQRNASSTLNVSSKHNASSAQNMSSSSNVSSVFSQRLNAFRTQLVPLSGAVALYNTSSPQYAAIRWLAQEDPKALPESTTLFELMQRYILSVLYFSTNGSHWISQNNFLTSGPVCFWHDIFGVFCDNHTVQLKLGRKKEILIDTRRTNKGSMKLTPACLFVSNNGKATMAWMGPFRASYGV